MITSKRVIPAKAVSSTPRPLDGITDALEYRIARPGPGDDEHGLSRCILQRGIDHPRQGLELEWFLERRAVAVFFGQAG